MNVFDILSHFSGVRIDEPKPRLRKQHNTGELIWTNGDELFTEPDEIVECIVKGVLETESFNSIYGEPGAGKSMATLELCLKVVSEKKFQWLGKEIQKRGDVLYIRYEGGRKKFKERFKKMCHALNLSPEEMKRFHSIENPPTLSVLEEEIRAKCELWKPVLIAVDSLYLSHEREENSNTEMRELGKLLQEFMNTYGLCVLVIHHTNKHIGDKPLHLDNFRGASMGALCESLMELRRDGRDETKRIWKWTKLRNGEDEDMHCEGGYFDPSTFVTEGTGEVDENEHLRGTMKKRKDFADYFEGVQGLQRSVLVERIMKVDNLKSDSSTYTRIEKALERGILKLNLDTKLIELGGK